MIRTEMAQERMQTQTESPPRRESGGPLRVLHLYRRFNPDFTGDGIYYERLIRLAADLDQIDHEVLVYDAPAGNAAYQRHQAYPPRVIHYLRDGPGEGAYWRLLNWACRNIGQYDVLHMHTHVDRYFLIWLLARWSGCKIIYSSTLEDSIPELTATYRPAYRPVSRLMFSRLDAVVAISPRLYSGGCGIRSDHAYLIPQGVEVTPLVTSDERATLRGQLGLAAEDIALLYIGSLIARKGILFLLQELAALRTVHPRIRLFLVGPATEPEHEIEIRAFIRDHDLSRDVIHVPFTERPQDYYDACDIFVFGSYSEGFGNVLLEAMVRAMPVVSRYLQEVTTTFIDHGKNGYLFSQSDGFQAAITRLIEDPDHRRRIGECARETVRARYDIADIAKRLYRLYRGIQTNDVVAGVSVPLPRRCADMAAGPVATGLRPIEPASRRPVLTIVIDTESEFIWSHGVTDDKGSVESVPLLHLVQDLCDPIGARICYVVDYPVATNPTSVPVMRALITRGGEVGVHLQPWTTPPVIEPLGGDHAFPGNLPVSLERLKLLNLKQAIEVNLGVVPRVYKAGRYGISSATLATLEELDFKVDLSVSPGFDYTRQGGPDFSLYPATPSWFGKGQTLLELPTTGGFVGPLAPIGSRVWSLSETALARGVRFRGALDRSGALSRLRLSPEGYSVRQMIKLTNHLMDQGVRHFTLSLHSSSLLTGFTPYSATPADVDILLRKIRDYLSHFSHQLDGTFATPTEIYDAELARAGRNA